MSRTGVQPFWGRLATSSGGVLLLVIVALSFWQEHKNGWSFLGGLLPFRHKEADSTSAKVFKAIFTPPVGKDDDPDESVP